MASLLAPVLNLLRRPRAPGSGEATPAAPSTPAAPLPSLPLELAGPFYDTSTLVAVSRTTKGCAASKMLSVQWAGVLERRFPCLAALPAFQAPLADAKAVVKGLLTATPPPPEPPRRGRSRGGGSLLPSAPRDGEGRALPLRDTVILAAQLSVRGDTALTHRPLLFGDQRMADVEDPTDDGTFGDSRWHIDIPLEAVGEGSSLMKLHAFWHFRSSQEEDDLDLDTLRDRWRALTTEERLSWAAAAPAIEMGLPLYGSRGLKDALSLPDLVHVDLASGETTPDVRTLCQDMCRAAETTLRQDIFIIAGNDVWRMSTPATTGSVTYSDGLVEGNFDDPLQWIRDGGGQDPPFVPLEKMFNNMPMAMSMEWNIGRYAYRGESLAEPMYYTTDGPGDLSCALCTWWDFGGSPEHDDFERHAATNTDDDDGHPYLCQLLAATRPVRVRTAQAA